MGERRKERVVLVAPHDEDTMLLAALFATAGYALSTVSDAATAVALCRSAPPDAVIVDLDTPGVDGAALVAQLRAVEECSHLRIVAVPSKAPTRVTNDARFDVVVKRPATVTKLIDSLGTPARR